MDDDVDPSASSSISQLSAIIDPLIDTSSTTKMDATETPESCDVVIASKDEPAVVESIDTVEEKLQQEKEPVVDPEVPMDTDDVQVEESKVADEEESIKRDEDGDKEEENGIQSLDEEKNPDGDIEPLPLETEEPTTLKSEEVPSEEVSMDDSEEVSQEEPLILSVPKVSKDDDEPLELSVSKEEPLELLVSKETEEEEEESEEEPLSLCKDEPLELSVPKPDEEEKVSKDEDEPLELSVPKVSNENTDDEPLELTTVGPQEEPLQLSTKNVSTMQEEPLELRMVKSPPTTILNGTNPKLENGLTHKKSDLIVAHSQVNGIMNGTISSMTNGNISQDDEEEDMDIDTLLCPPLLKELSPEELKEKENKVRKLRYQLEQEEMKLVLLKKIRQSQILKETNDNNDTTCTSNNSSSSKIDRTRESSSAGHRMSRDMDGRIDTSRTSGLSSSHGAVSGHHSSSVHGLVPPGHAHQQVSSSSSHHISSHGSHHSSRSSSSGHHGGHSSDHGSGHRSGSNHLPAPPSRHSMGPNMSMSSSTLPPAHSGSSHRMSDERHRVRDHGSSRGDPMARGSMSRSGVFNPPVPQIHRSSGIPSHHGPPPGLTPAHSGSSHSSSSRSGLMGSSAVPAPAHGGHTRSTMPGSASSSSSSRLPMTGPPNVSVGYTPPPVVKERPIETPAQKLDRAKKSIRSNLEKTLLNLPLPKVPTPEMHFVPNFNQLEFQYYMGLEAVVDLLTDSPNIGKPPPDPFECYQCGTDFTPVWKWQDVADPRGSGRPAVICEGCVSRNIRRAIRNDHTAKIKSAIQAASREEKEVEAKIAAGTYSPPVVASPAPVSLPAPPVPRNIEQVRDVPKAVPSPPSIPSSFDRINSNVAHRSSRESHRRERESHSSHHSHRNDPMAGLASASGGMIAPPAAHSSGSSYSSGPRMSGDELGRRRERSPQVRDTGSSSSSMSANSAAAAAAAQAAAVNAAAAQIFAQMQKMTPQQQALFLSQSLGGLGPMANPQAMLSLAPLLLGQFGLGGMGGLSPSGGSSGNSSKNQSNQMTAEQMQQRMFLEMMTNPSIAGLGLPPQQSGGGSGSGSSSSRSHRDSSGYRNH